MDQYLQKYVNCKNAFSNSIRTRFMNRTNFVQNRASAPALRASGLRHIQRNEIVAKLNILLKNQSRLKLLIVRRWTSPARER
jgi:hypothetical protein